MNNAFAIASVVLKEFIRRKDFYVLLVLTALLTLLMAGMNFFNEDRIFRDVKEICLLLVWLSALVIAIGATARQLPAERENRTIFPLLAKPVTRGEVVAGKFLGCWLACGVALLVFYFFLGVFAAMREHQWPLPIYYQGIWLHWMGLGIVTAATLLGSLVFAAPSSNGTIIFVCCAGILLVGRDFNDVAARLPGPLGALAYAAYFVMPHLEFFDARRLVVHSWDAIPLVPFVFATVYAAAYTALFLVVAWLVFRRKPLN
ncbi:MAG: ABC transporter permease [Verrucomicrobia bacterium]|nr:ABC transporter permease [Verrucomicrobiota bacterium]